MKSYLKIFFEERNWDKDAAKHLLNYNDLFGANERCKETLLKWTSLYEKDVHIDYSEANKEISEAAENAGLGVYESQLLLYLYFSYYLQEHYRQAGLPLEVWAASMDDLKWKAVECHKLYNVWGTFVASWFPRFFELTRFALGRLQFEAMPFPEGYVSAGGYRPEGATHVLNVHIPSSGHLDHDSCLSSYRMAVNFWKKHFGLEAFGGQIPLFHCGSWLLAPSHEEFLPEHSNILQFQRDYRLYETRMDSNYSNLWRFFDCIYNGEPDSLPENNSLQRAYKKWLKAGHVPEIGLGVMDLTGFSFCNSVPPIE